MLPDVGATELMVIAAVALIVVGPKDLPVLMRKVGQFLARMRGMAAEFRASFDEMARQSELDELRREVQALRTGQYGDAQAAQAAADQVFSEIEADLAAMPPRVPVTPPSPVTDILPEYAMQPLAEPEAAPVVKKPRAPRKPRAAPAAADDAPPAAKPRARAKPAPEAEP